MNVKRVGNRFSDILIDNAGRSLGEAKTTYKDTDEAHLHRRHLFGWVVGGLAVLFAVGMVLAIVAGAYYPHSGMMGYPYPYHWYFFPFGFVVFFIFLFLIGRMLFWPWGWGGRRGYWYSHDGAAEILRERYAKGEITKDQFEQMSRDLEQRR